MVIFRHTCTEEEEVREKRFKETLATRFKGTLATRFKETLATVKAEGDLSTHLQGVPI